MDIDRGIWAKQIQLMQLINEVGIIDDMNLCAIPLHRMTRCYTFHVKSNRIREEALKEYHMYYGPYRRMLMMTATLMGLGNAAVALGNEEECADILEL